MLSRAQIFENYTYWSLIWKINRAARSQSSKQECAKHTASLQSTYASTRHGFCQMLPLPKDFCRMLSLPKDKRVFLFCWIAFISRPCFSYGYLAGASPFWTGSAEISISVFWILVSDHFEGTLFRALCSASVDQKRKGKRDSRIRVDLPWFTSSPRRKGERRKTTVQRLLYGSFRSVDLPLFLGGNGVRIKLSCWLWNRAEIISRKTVSYRRHAVGPAH